MRGLRHRTVAVALVSAVVSFAAAGGELPPFSEYEVILDRKPFGDLVKASPQDQVAEDAAEAARAEEQKKNEQALARQIDLVAVNITPRGKVAVGIVDKSAKPSRSLYLSVGESEFGYTIVDANFEEETASIEKDGTTITLKLGKGLVDTSAVKAAQEGSAADGMPQDAGAQSGGQARSPAPFSRIPVRIDRGAQVGGNGESASSPPRGIRPAGVAARGGYLEQLRRRNLESAQAAAAERSKMQEEVKAMAESATKEAAAKREREINLELIKQGKEPLSPIELTPEEDAELVKKGVFSNEEPPE